MYAAMPWLGLVLFLATLRPFLQRRTYVTTMNMIAATCCLIAFVLWPDENAMALDRIIPVAGLGHLVSRVTMTVAVALHYIAVCVSINLWNRRHRLLLLPTALFMAIYICYWVAAHGEHIQNLEALFYHGYHGHPDTILWMSVWRGITIIWYSCVVTYVYVVVGLRTPDVWRWTSFITGGAFAGSALMGAMAIDEALADRAGSPSSALLSLFTYLLVGCCGIIVLTYVVYTTLRPLWRLRQIVRDYPMMEARHQEICAEQDELRALRQDIRDFNLRMSDDAVLLHPWADRAFVGKVKQHCLALQVDADEIKVGIEAARQISLNPENIERLQRAEDLAFESGDDASLSAARYARLAKHDVWFFGDVYLVIFLVLGGERLGLTPRRAPQEWHRRLADIIAGVLAEHKQEPGLLESYRTTMANREAARTDYVAGLLEDESA